MTRRQRDAEDELRREIQNHLDLEAEELEARGKSAGEARKLARKAFGNEGQVREEVRNVGRWMPFDTFVRDARFALRLLVKNASFSIVAVLTIALGIGANTAIFAVLNGLLLKPLPYRGSEGIVYPATVFKRSGTDRGSVAYPDILDWKEQTEIFEAVAAFNRSFVDFTDGDAPERILGLAVDRDYFRVFTDRPIAGRVFLPEEDAPGANDVVVLSEGLWRRRFGGDPGVVGKTIEISGKMHRVVGVMPAHSTFPEEAEVFKPMGIGSQKPADLMRRDNHMMQALARLRTGVDFDAAASQIAAMGERVARDYTNRENTGWKLHRLKDFVIGPSLQLTLWILMGAVLLVLLTACVNVANLLLARGETRQREVAVRSALGAGRGRVAGQFLVESLMLALAGGLLGAVLGFAAARALVSIAPANVPRLEAVSVDLTVLAFAFALCVGTAVVFGLAPVFHSVRTAPVDSLRESGRGSSSSGASTRLRSVLVVSEFAIALILVTGAFLLLRSVGNLQQVDPGFQTENLLTLQLSLPSSRYRNDQVSQTYAEIIESIRAVPGVAAVSSTGSLPLNGGGIYLTRAFLRAGQPEPPASSDTAGSWSVIQPGYLDTIGVPVIEGRGFTANDTAESNPVILISAAMAKEMFPQGGAIGKRIRSWRDENKYREIVGIVKDLKFRGLGDPIVNNVYVPHAQDSWSFQVLMVRTSGDPMQTLPAIQSAIWNRDPKLALALVKTVSQIVDDELARPRFLTMLLGGFAITALLMAAIGIYGLMAYSVAQRSREIGIRMALGAIRKDITSRVTRDALLLAGIGAGIGAVGALSVTRLMSSLLFGVSPTDLGAILVAAGTLIVVALLAAYVPARRASRVDPLVVLRYE